MYILALDQGTTSSRSIVFDREGRVLSVRQNEHRQIYPRSGWVEHDPWEIWRSQMETAVDALVWTETVLSPLLLVMKPRLVTAMKRGV